MMYDFWESSQYEADYWQGVLVITDKATRQCGNVVLYDTRGHNVTHKQWLSSIKSHGPERALSTWSKLVNKWEG